MAKSDKLTVQKRVQDVRTLILSGAEFASIKAFAADHGWNVTDRQLQRYVNKANKQFAKVSRRSLRSQLGRHLLQRRMLYARANKAGDLKTALSVARDEAKLQGLYPSAKIVPATPDGDHASAGPVEPPLDRRQRLVRMLQAEARGDKIELKLLAQVAPQRVYRMPDTQLPLAMLNTLALAYVNRQLEFAMTYLHAVHCSMLELVDAAEPTEDDPADDLSWDEIASVFGHQFRIGEAGWQMFMRELGLERDALTSGNYDGCMLAIAREALGDAEVSADDLAVVARVANCSVEQLPTSADVCRRWQKQLSHVLKPH